MKNLLKILNHQLSDPKKLSYSLEDETLMDFPGYPGSEIGINTEYAESEILGIYMTFAIGESDYLQEFMEHAESFFKPLRKYLELIFSENTNNDACSFSYSIDTQHGLTKSDSEHYTITVSVTDYLS